jgi:hypothetical protein
LSGIYVLSREKAIELYFDKLDEMIADKRIDNLKSGKSTVVPLEEKYLKGLSFG